MAAIEIYRASELPRLCRAVSRVISQGGIVAVPTETYYGLGVNPCDARAVDRLLRIKGRDEGKPLLVLIGQLTHLSGLVQDVPAIAQFLMDNLWPGPLTMVLTAHPSVPANLTAGTGTIGVRLSPCTVLRELLEQVGPLTGTSANRAGAAPAQTAAQVQEAFGDAIDLIIDAGPTPGGLPSTVIDARDGVRILRDGAVTRQMLQNVLQTRGLSLL